jgi:hypothetical protein
MPEIHRGGSQKSRSDFNFSSSNFISFFTGRRWTEVELDEEEEEDTEEGKDNEPGSSESLPPFRGRASTDGNLLSRPRRWRYPPPAPSSQQQYQNSGCSRADRRMSISMRGNNASCWIRWATRCQVTTPAIEHHEQVGVNQRPWMLLCNSLTVSKNPQPMKRVKISVWGNNANCWREQLLRAHQADEKNIIDTAISDIFQILRLRSDRRRWRYLALEDTNWYCDTKVFRVFGCWFRLCEAER